MNTIQYYVGVTIVSSFSANFPPHYHTILILPICNKHTTNWWSKWQFCLYCVELTWSQYMCKSYSAQIHIMEKNYAKQVLHNSSPWVTSGVFCIYKSEYNSRKGLHKSFSWVTQGNFSTIHHSKHVTLWDTVIQHKTSLGIMRCHGWDAMDEMPCMRHHGIVWQRFHETPWDTSLA